MPTDPTTPSRAAMAASEALDNAGHLGDTIDRHSIVEIQRIIDAALQPDRLAADELVRFATHKRNCAWRQLPNNPCNCGYDYALAAYKKTREP